MGPDSAHMRALDDRQGDDAKISCHLVLYSIVLLTSLHCLLEIFGASTEDHFQNVAELH